MRWWPASALVGFVLIQARLFVDTPSLTEDMQATPSAGSVNYIDNRVVDLFIGYGLTVLGLAFVALFVAGLVHSVTKKAPQSFAAPIIAIGGGATLAATFRRILVQPHPRWCSRGRSRALDRGGHVHDR